MKALPWSRAAWMLHTRPGETFHIGTCSRTTALHLLSCNDNCQHLRHCPDGLGTTLCLWLSVAMAVPKIVPRPDQEVLANGAKSQIRSKQCTIHMLIRNMLAALQMDDPALETGERHLHHEHQHCSACQRHHLCCR